MKIKYSHSDIYVNLQSDVKNTQNSYKAYSTIQRNIIKVQKHVKKVDYHSHQKVQ